MAGVAYLWAILCLTLGTAGSLETYYFTRVVYNNTLIIDVSEGVSMVSEYYKQNGTKERIDASYEENVCQNTDTEANGLQCVVSYGSKPLSRSIKQLKTSIEAVCEIAPEELQNGCEGIISPMKELWSDKNMELEKNNSATLTSDKILSRPKRFEPITIAIVLAATVAVGTTVTGSVGVALLYDSNNKLQGRLDTQHKQYKAALANVTKLAKTQHQVSDERATKQEQYSLKNTIRINTLSEVFVHRNTMIAMDEYAQKTKRQFEAATKEATMEEIHTMFEEAGALSPHEKIDAKYQNPEVFKHQSKIFRHTTEESSCCKSEVTLTVETRIEDDEKFSRVEKTNKFVSSINNSVFAWVKNSKLNDVMQMQNKGLLLPARIVKTFNKEIQVHFPDEQTIYFLVHETTNATYECYDDEEHKLVQKREAPAKTLWHVPSHCSLTCEFWHIARMPHRNMHSDGSHHDFQTVLALAEMVVKYPNASLEQQRELAEILNKTSNIGEDLSREILILEDDELMIRYVQVQQQSDSLFNNILYKVGIPAAVLLGALFILGSIYMHFKKKVCTLC